MKLVSHRQLTGVYGTVGPGVTFDCPDEIAVELIKAGLAHRSGPPRVLYETKVIVPAEVGPIVPFRDVPVPDTEPTGLAADGNSVFSAADVSKQRALNPGGRRGRARPGVGR